MRRRRTPYWNMWRVILTYWIARHPKPFFVVLGILIVTIYNSVSNQTKMDKIYHIYDKENRVEYAKLNEEDFAVVWRNIDQNRYEYEELTVDHTTVADSSY